MSGFGFDKIRAHMEQAKRTLPLRVGNVAQRYFIGAIDKGAWDGQLYAPKKNSKNTLPFLVGKSGGTKKGAHQHLRQSVAHSLQDGPTFENIEFKVPQVYAIVHNEGLKAGRGKGFIMPKRQFMGNSKELMNTIRTMVNETMKSVLMPR